MDHGDAGITHRLLSQPASGAVGTAVVHHDPLDGPMVWELLAPPSGPGRPKGIEVVVGAEYG